MHLIPLRDFVDSFGNASRKHGFGIWGVFLCGKPLRGRIPNRRAKCHRGASRGIKYIATLNNRAMHLTPAIATACAFAAQKAQRLVSKTCYWSEVHRPIE